MSADTFDPVATLDFLRALWRVDALQRDLEHSRLEREEQEQIPGEPQKEACHVDKQKKV